MKSIIFTSGFVLMTICGIILMCVGKFDAASCMLIIAAINLIQAKDAENNS